MNLGLAEMRRAEARVQNRALTHARAALVGGLGCNLQPVVVAGQRFTFSATDVAAGSKTVGVRAAIYYLRSIFEEEARGSRNLSSAQTSRLIGDMGQMLVERLAVVHWAISMQGVRTALSAPLLSDPRLYGRKDFQRLAMAQAGRLRNACTRAGVDPSSLRLGWQAAGDRAAREEVRRLRPRLGDRMAAKLSRWENVPVSQVRQLSTLPSQTAEPEDALVGPLIRRRRLSLEMITENRDTARESRRLYWLQAAEETAANKRAMAEAEAVRNAALLGRSRRLARDREASIRSERTKRRSVPQVGGSSRGSLLAASSLVAADD